MDFCQSSKIKNISKKKVQFCDQIEIIGYSQAHEIIDLDEKDTEIEKDLASESKTTLHWSMFMKDNTNDTSEENEDDNAWMEETYIFDQVSD